MVENLDNTLSIIKQVLGREIKAMYRVYFQLRGEVIQNNEFPLQFEFVDGSFLLLQGGQDGESLAATQEEWRDPYSANEHTDSSIYEFGQFILTNHSNDANYALLIGNTISQVRPILFDLGVKEITTVSGVQFKVGSTYLNFFYAMDMCQVYWGENPPELEVYLQKLA